MRGSATPTHECGGCDLTCGCSPSERWDLRGEPLHKVAKNSPALKRVLPCRGIFRSAKALLPPHECEGSHLARGCCRDECGGSHRHAAARPYRMRVLLPLCCGLTILSAGGSNGVRASCYCSFVLSSFSRISLSHLASFPNPTCCHRHLPDASTIQSIGMPLSGARSAM